MLCADSCAVAGQRSGRNWLDLGGQARALRFADLGRFRIPSGLRFLDGLPQEGFGWGSVPREAPPTSAVGPLGLGGAMGLCVGCDNVSYFRKQARMSQ